MERIPKYLLSTYAYMGMFEISAYRGAGLVYVRWMDSMGWNQVAAIIKPGPIYMNIIKKRYMYFKDLVFVLMYVLYI